MKTKTQQTNLRPALNTLAASLLLLAAAGVVLPASRARADDTVKYSDTVRYYETITPGGKATPRRRMARLLGFMRLEPRGARAFVPARIVVTDRPDAGIVFHAAEATGAAQGQTVNRATNDLN